MRLGTRREESLLRFFLRPRRLLTGVTVVVCGRREHIPRGTLDRRDRERAGDALIELHIACRRFNVVRRLFLGHSSFHEVLRAATQRVSSRFFGLHLDFGSSYGLHFDLGRGCGMHLRIGNSYAPSASGWPENF